VAQIVDLVCFSWQARRDSNPQPPDLESGALAVRATGLQEGVLYTGFVPESKAKTGAAETTVPGRQRRLSFQRLLFISPCSPLHCLPLHSRHLPRAAGAVEKMHKPAVFIIFLLSQIIKAGILMTPENEYVYFIKDGAITRVFCGLTCLAPRPFCVNLATSLASFYHFRPDPAIFSMFCRCYGENTSYHTYCSVPGTGAVPGRTVQEGNREGHRR
jgi:hypothetical protein